jgi:hypothetical protein
MNKSLAEALPEEMARVRELIVQYRDPELNGAGVFAARMMEISLQRAERAMINGNIVAMLEVYQDLKGYSD